MAVPELTGSNDATVWFKLSKASTLRFCIHFHLALITSTKLGDVCLWDIHGIATVHRNRCCKQHWAWSCQSFFACRLGSLSPDEIFNS